MEQRNDHHLKSISSPVYIPSVNNNNIPLIPATPGPQPANSLLNNAKDRFAGIVWTQKNPSYSLDDYFLEYDHWEPYSENKSYSKRIYQAAYKGIMKDYNNYLYILESDNNEEYYVVSKRIPNELETLESYCTCSLCVCSWLNPLKYLWCPYCTKCIKAGAGFASQNYIEKARKIKLEHDTKTTKPLPKYYKFFQNISWIKISEIVIIGSIVSIGLWSYF